MQLRPPAFFGEHKIALTWARASRRSTRPAHKLTLADGRDVAWDALLLATGAEPVRLPLPGADLPHVHDPAHARGQPRDHRSARRARDARGRDRRELHRARGGGVAARARPRGPRRRAGGGAARAHARRRGRRVRARACTRRTASASISGRRSTAVEPDAVTLSGGDERVTADLVVIGVGVRPRSSWRRRPAWPSIAASSSTSACATARRASWRPATSRAIPYAPTGEQVRIEHWVVAERQGRVAALNMLGRRLPFTAPPFFWSDALRRDARRTSATPRAGTASTFTATSPRATRTLVYRRGGQTLAVVTLGRDHTSLEAEVAMEAGDQATLAAFGRTR